MREVATIADISINTVTKVKRLMTKKMKMTAIDFFSNYDDLLEELGSVIRPEYYHLIIRIREEDPHDLVTPEMEFESRHHAVIHIWKILLRDFIKSDYLSPN
jgi:hypothetical protein